MTENINRQEIEKIATNLIHRFGKSADFSEINVVKGFSDSNINGTFNIRTKQISIRSNMTKEKFEKTLLHEIGHSIFPDDVLMNKLAFLTENKDNINSISELFADLFAMEFYNNNKKICRQTIDKIISKVNRIVISNSEYGNGKLLRGYNKNNFFEQKILE